jgi:aspartate/methionine/tyrosine aminotransferase
MSRIKTVMNDYLTGPVALPVQSIGLWALQRAEQILAKSRRMIEENIKILSGWVSRHDQFRWVKPAGGTVCFVKLPANVDDVKLSNRLREKYSTLVPPGQFFWKKGFIRISYGIDGETLRSGLRNILACVEELTK